MFKSQKITPWIGYGCDGWSTQEHKKNTDLRINTTIDFILEFTQQIPKTILDVAGPSYVGIEIAKRLVAYYNHTSGDIDLSTWSTNMKKCDMVLMLEVIEHILNPLQFLRELKDRVDFKYMVLSWPCRPSWLWTPIHYHEIQLNRFEYLVERAGYKIVKVQKGRLHESWYNKFKGIRPFFRYFVNRHYMVIIEPIYF